MKSIVWVLLLGGAGWGSPAQFFGQHTSSPAAKPGQTIFSRSDSVSATPPSAKPEKPDENRLISDAERTALTFQEYRLEVHLAPAQHLLSVRANLTAENSSGKPLTKISLQLSSSLHWEALRINGTKMQFHTERMESDIDHTGELTEALIPLVTPLAPGARIQVDGIYSGTIGQSAQRLLRLGAPEEVAKSSEWDQINPDFTALRGFGNVIWFPVSASPVLLGEGPQVFDAIGQWKLRESAATIAIQVLVEYIGKRPAAVVLNGTVLPPEETSPVLAEHVASDVPRVAKFSLSATPLGFHPLSLFVLATAQESFPGVTIYPGAPNKPAASVYARIAEENRPLVEQWLGMHRERPIVLVDLPESTDLPFEESNVLFLPLKTNASNDTAGPVLAHMWSHAYFVSKRPWLDEGVAQWMTLAWIEQRAGRRAAIEQMDSRRAALALAETSDPGVDSGQTLVNAWSDIYYRDKAADVLWMLRDTAGDAAFAKALASYRSAQDTEPSYLQKLLEKSSGKRLEWFFDDWVYRDRGLPDLHIESAYQRPILAKDSSARSYLVSVEVRNDSSCSAEVPVTIETDAAPRTGRLRVPAHGRASVRILVEGRPMRALVNDGSVPEVQSSRHEEPVRAAP